MNHAKKERKKERKKVGHPFLDGKGSRRCEFQRRRYLRHLLPLFVFVGSLLLLNLFPRQSRAEEAIARTAEGWDQVGPGLAQHPDGMFKVVWTTLGIRTPFGGWEGQDGQGDSVIGQMILPSGYRLGEEIFVNDYWEGDQFNPAAAVFDSDHYGTAWVSAVPGDYTKTYFRVFDSSGTPYYNDVPILQSSTHSAGQMYPLTCAVNEGFVVVSLTRNPGPDVSAALHLTRFSKNGMWLTTAPVVSAGPYYIVLPDGGYKTIFRNLSHFDIACTSDGHVAVVYGYYHELDGRVTKLVIMDPDDGFLLYSTEVGEWQEIRPQPALAISDDESMLHVSYGVQLDATGFYNDTIVHKGYPFGSENPIQEDIINDPSLTEWYNYWPRVSTRGGQTIFVWRQAEKEDPENQRIRAARFDADWEPLGWEDFEGETEVTLNSRYKVAPTVSSGVLMGRPSLSTPDDEGRFVVAWTASRLEGMDLDPVIRCFDAQGKGFPCGPDWDGDGVPNEYDCDPLNPYLRYDLDQDGVCDEITGGDEADCINACDEVYEGTEIDDCIYRCQNLDNCPCFRDECPEVGDPDRIAAWEIWDEYCRSYKWCINNALTDCGSSRDADICHKFFANPDQQDSSGNGRGDKCESRPQAHIGVFDQSGTTNDISKGHIFACAGTSADVSVTLRGGWMEVDPWADPPIIDPDGIYQRTHVGGCGCPPELNESLCKDLHCPDDRELDQDNLLAWEAIHSIEATHKPNVGELVECADCPEFLDHREPRNKPGIPDWKSYAINKQLLFNHDSGSNHHFFSWDWTTYGKDTGKEDLAGKKVQLRVAWQNPDLAYYVYHESSDDHLVFSDNTFDAEGRCFGMSIPWEIRADSKIGSQDRGRRGARPVRREEGEYIDVFNRRATQQVGMDRRTNPGAIIESALSEPLLVLIEGVWPDPHPQESTVGDPIPWAVVSDAMTADHLFVSFNQNLQVSKIYPITPSPGAAASLELSNSAATAGVLDAVIVAETPAPALFRFGGLDLSGAVSNTLLIGLPHDSRLGWRTAEEIYGSQAAEGPYLQEPKLIFDRRAQRLVVIGDETDGFGPVPVPGRSHRMWTFDLKTGRWAEIGGLPIPESMKGYTINVDTARNRALLVGSNGATHHHTVVYDLNLSTLQVTELVTVVSAEGPGGLEDHGASLDSAGQALYVYGGWSDGAPSAKAFKLDLVSRRWEYLGEGLEGPGFMDKPFVMYHNSTNRLWVADRGEGARAQIEYWGLDEHGWLKRTTLEQRDPDDWEIDGTFSVGSPNRHLVYVDDTHELPGKLLLARLVSSDPTLGLRVTDSSGRLVGEDISTGTENKVAFYGSGGYWVEVVAGEGHDPSTRPAYELSLREAELQEVAEYTGGDRVSKVVVEGETAYLHSGKLLQAVDLSNPLTPLFVGWASLGGKGIGLDMCGGRLCVSHSTGRPNLSVVDISTPWQPVLLGTGRVPGQSRGIAAKSGSIVYTAERNKGVSIWNTANPADPQKMGKIETAGNAILLELSSNLLFVSGRESDGIAVYDVTDPAAPMLVGGLSPGGHTAGMRVDGGKLHVTIYEKQSDWAKCNAGAYCGPGTITRVYDISDIASPVDLGTYDPAEKPAAEMKSLKGGYVLVRQKAGFKVYEAVTAAE